MLKGPSASVCLSMKLRLVLVLKARQEAAGH
jgi:hypothetical protein